MLQSETSRFARNPLDAGDEALRADAESTPRADPVLPASPPALLHRLQYDDFTIEAADGAGGGVMGAKKLSLRFPRDAFCMDIKWKAAPSGGEGWNNSPRREVGAYAAQSLFLDAADYVVPPVAARAIPLQDYSAVDEKAAANIDGTSCVFGSMAVWLDVTEYPKKAFDPKRLEEDLGYAFHFANLNLFAYLIAHRDARGSNFLTPADPDDPRIFSIDNSIAFGGVLYNFFTWHFDEIRVRGLPRQSIERLRHVSRTDLDRFGVLGELHPDATGVLRTVAPTANLNPEVGTRVSAGRVQFGLTTPEIDAMESRLVDLLARIDNGELALF